MPLDTPHIVLVTSQCEESPVSSAAPHQHSAVISSTGQETVSGVVLETSDWTMVTLEL